MYRRRLLLLFLLAALTLSGCAERPAAPVSAPEAAPTAAPETASGLDGLVKTSDAAQYVSALPTEDPFKREIYDGPPSLLDPSAPVYDAVTDFTIAEVPQQDMSRMSATMAYAQLYNIFMEQEKYVGQTLRMRGQYAPMRDENGQAKYHFIMVYDNAACCELGLEFIWLSPGAYPKDQSLIELTGVFDICNDGGEKFCVLRVKDVTVLKEAAGT